MVRLELPAVPRDGSMVCRQRRRRLERVWSGFGGACVRSQPVSILHLSPGDEANEWESGRGPMLRVGLGSGRHEHGAQACGGTAAGHAHDERACRAHRRRQTPSHQPDEVGRPRRRARRLGGGGGGEDTAAEHAHRRAAQLPVLGHQPRQPAWRDMRRSAQVARCCHLAAATYGTANEAQQAPVGSHTGRSVAEQVGRRPAHHTQIVALNHRDSQLLAHAVDAGRCDDQLGAR